MTLWEDLFDRTTRPVTYSNFNSKDLAFWKDQLGNSERIENIKWAKANCGGKFRVVLTRARDVEAHPRSIAAARADENLIMQIKDFDPDTGEFSAVSVES